MTGSGSSRTAGSVVGNVLLNLAALGGVVCIVLVALAFFFNITLIMFKTGSMSPTIPAGSLSVVHEIPAADVAIGDIVTIDRPQGLPITHRVTSTTGGGETRTITMKGDANEAEDPQPYVVDHVRIVLLSVPNLAYAVVWMSNPMVLGLLTVGASGLVTWAFWPRGQKQTGKRSDPEHPGAGGRKAPRRVARHASKVGALLALPVLAATAGVLADAGPVQAATTQQVISGNYLTLTSIGDFAAMAKLAPGEPMQWEVGIAAAPPDPGIVDIGVSASGTAVLIARIRVCDLPWSNGVCGSGERLLADGSPLQADGAVHPLDQMPSSEQRWLLLDLALPAFSTASVQGASADVAVHASGTNDTVSVQPDRQPGQASSLGGLAMTGADFRWLPLASFVAVMAGLLLATATGRRRRS